MDSQAALSALQALRNTFADEVTGAQAKVDALDVAFDLLKNGYQSDIEAAKALLQPQLDAKDAEIENLTTQLTTAKMVDAVSAPAPAISSAVG